MNDEDIDVIHWNAGIWDCLRLFEEEPHTPVEIYDYYIERICIKIKKLCPNAEVIFATTTKVLSEKMIKQFMRLNEDIEKYNEVAVEIVKRYGFKVNDLYLLSQSLPENAHSDGTHYYTSIGAKAFVEEVLAYVSPLLDLDNVPEYNEMLYLDDPVKI